MVSRRVVDFAKGGRENKKGGCCFGNAKKKNQAVSLQYTVDPTLRQIIKRLVKIIIVAACRHVFYPGDERVDRLAERRWKVESFNGDFPFSKEETKLDLNIIQTIRDKYFETQSSCHGKKVPKEDRPR